MLFGTAIFATRFVHYFLAITDPLEAPILVVEGWLPDYALDEAMQIFCNGEYELLITTGGPLDHGHYLSQYKTHAALAAAILLKLGIEEGSMQPVPAPTVRRNRTFASAQSVARWLQEFHPDRRRINVVALGVHARRTSMMYQQALPKHFAVGIIALEDLDYDPKRWWRTSAGIRSVITESAAYLHAIFLFDPELETDTK